MGILLPTRFLAVINHCNRDILEACLVSQLGLDLCVCVCREHSYVQLCAELSGSVPDPAPQAATTPPDRVQVGRQELLDLSTLLGCRRRLSATSAAQSGPRGDLWRGDCWDIRRLPPGQAGMDGYSAARAGQVR